MTANQAIEIINNAQNYSEHEYNFATHQVKEWKRHSEALMNIQEIDEDVYKQSDKFEEIKNLLSTYKNKHKHDTFDYKDCNMILQIVGD